MEDIRHILNCTVATFYGFGAKYRAIMKGHFASLDEMADAVEAGQPVRLHVVLFA